MCNVNWDRVINALIAFGTLAVAALAIWGDWFRSVLSPSKLSLQLHTPEGVPARLFFKNVNTPDGLKFMYYHMKVVNDRRWIPVHDCRVMLTGLSKRGPDNLFHKLDFPVPLEFIWAPAERDEPIQRRRTIVREQVLDLGAIRENDKHFIPQLYKQVSSFEGFVGKDEAVRYYIEIEALNYASRRPQIFEVAWDGVFDFSPEKMRKHMVIREVPWREAYPEQGSS